MKYLRVCPVLFGLMACLRCPAQDAHPLASTLLWRISGNGFSRPCYLYGTMHLTDARLFNLGDSLYRALEQTEGFAMEVDPQELSLMLADMMTQEVQAGQRRLSDLMGPEYKKYSAALSRRLKKPAGEITTGDVFRERNNWMKEALQKGSMRTFLDAYLYDIARRLGKWTGGIEDYQDQEGLMDNLVDESDIRELTGVDPSSSGPADAQLPMETFIRTYLSGNLEEIDRISHLSDSAYRDALLVRRNMKMARRMDSLGHIRSMVFAVGAAHLPGSDGVIRLLQKRGFRVEPVFFSRRIAPQDYRIQDVEQPWTDVKDSSGLYEAQMPGHPGEVSLFGVLRMKIYYDLVNSTAYFTMGLQLPYDQRGMDSIKQLMARQLFHLDNLNKARKVQVGDLEARELENDGKDGYFRGYVLNRGTVFYLAMVQTIKKDNRIQRDAEKFLASFRATRPAPAQLDSQGLTYVDSRLGFQLQLPAAPQSGDSLVANRSDTSFQRHMMLCQDPETGSYLFFGANSVTRGYYLVNDSTCLASVHAQVRSKFASLERDSLYRQGDHWVLELRGPMNQTNSAMRAYYESRGNRWYTLMALYDANRPQPGVERFFSSFRLLDLPPAPWRREVTPDSVLSTWIPSDWLYRDPRDNAGSGSLLRYEAFDSLQADDYNIHVETFSRYYWAASDSVFWNHVQAAYTPQGDSLLSRKELQQDGLRGMEILLRQPSSNLVRRKRMLLYGNQLYILVARQPGQGPQRSQVDLFFDSLRFCRPAPPTTLFTDHTEALLRDLGSPDSAMRAEAREGLSNASFTAADLPRLHAALLGDWPDSGQEKEDTRAGIVRQIEELHDSSSLTFAKNAYLRTGDAELRSLLLQLISQYKTRDNYQDMTRLLLQAPPAGGLDWTLVGDLNDSLDLTASLFPGLLPLLKDSSMTGSLLHLLDPLVDSGRVSMDQLRTYRAELLAYAACRYRALASDQDDLRMGDYELMSLLGRFRDPACNARLQQFLQIPQGYLRLRCLRALLANRQPVSNQVLTELARDRNYRISLYQALEKAGRTALFPAPYRRQQLMAESMVWESASDHESPSAITYLTQRVETFRGRKARFYYFKLTYGDPAADSTRQVSHYLGGAGPFDPDPARLSLDEANGSLYTDAEFDPDSLPDQIQALLQQLAGETTDGHAE
ncbi:MAG TPA: TraB/GumN family protein [Chitinophagaceae bacterium]|nr:TraB/GumN family protein [Chitinophagaceae bacterium]